MNDSRECARQMLDFIEKSPSSYHVIASVRAELEKKGFQPLRETEPWELQDGCGYYVIRNDSSLIGFRLPEDSRGPEGFHITASHSDSPSFKVKCAPEMIVEEHYLKLNTEKYGGMILSTWLDRALSVAGRVAVQENGGVVTRLVNVEEDLLVIPNVAVHLNRNINSGIEYNPQVDMLPLYAGFDKEKGKDRFMRRIGEAAGVKPEDILGHDLFL